MDYSSLNKDILIVKCKEFGIKKYSNKTKNQIIELLNNYNKLNNNDDNIIKKSEIKQTDEKYKIKINDNKLSNKILKPLIKWSGGKSDEINSFINHLPKEYDTYIEPFVGGGSLFFHLFPEKAVINDVHTELIDFYNSIKEGNIKDIYNFMKQNLNDEDTYYKIRDKMIINNKLDNAKRFYYQRKTCFRGMLRYNKQGKFNIPFGKYKTINYEELQNPKYEELLKRTEILNKNFDYIFENYNNENNFMFLDPPYDSEFTDYGYCNFGKNEHIKLAKLFKETKIKCLMIIGKTDFIYSLYKDYIVDEYDKKYRFKLYDDRVGNEINTKHLIIKNY